MPVTPDYAQEHGLPGRWKTAALVLLALVPVGFAMVLQWDVDSHGMLAHNGKLLSWDFTSTWAGGVLGRQGRFDIVYDHIAYSEWLRSLFGPKLAAHEWLYPPPLFLVAVPLGLLALPVAYVVWTFGTATLLLGVLGAAGFSLAELLLVCLSPALWKSVMFGQNGALMAACLAGGLLLARSRPVTGGLLLGLLVLKPHLGLLVPVYVVATRNWRLGAAMVGTAALLGLATLICFGPAPFALFVSQAQPLMRATLEAPWPQPFQMNGTTVFLMARAFGASPGGAYAMQGLAAVSAAGILWRCGRVEGADHRLLVALVLCLALLATPYAFSYDCIPVEIAALVAAADRRWAWTPVLALAWMWPGLTNFANALIGPLTPLVIAALAATIALRLRRDDRHRHVPDPARLAHPAATDRDFVAAITPRSSERGAQSGTADAF